MKQISTKLKGFVYVIKTANVTDYFAFTVSVYDVLDDELCLAVHGCQTLVDCFNFIQHETTINYPESFAANIIFSTGDKNYA